MRPWLGLTDVYFVLTNPDELIIKFDNCGRTPVQNVEIGYRIYEPYELAKLMDEDTEHPKEKEDEEGFPIGMVFPQEPAESRIEPGGLKQLREEHKDVVICGQLKYTSGCNVYTTEFQIGLGFSDDSGQVHFWANTSAT
jgi:hypothetical protein